MQNFKVGLLLLFLCTFSFLAGKYYGPKVQSVQVEENKRTDTVKNVDKKETILPDGTKIIETKSTTSKTTDKKVSSESKSVSRSEWQISTIYFPEIRGFQEQNIILGIHKRVIGEVYLGISVSTQKQVGASLSIGF